MFRCYCKHFIIVKPQTCVHYSIKLLIWMSINLGKSSNICYWTSHCTSIEHTHETTLFGTLIANKPNWSFCRNDNIYFGTWVYQQNWNNPKNLIYKFWHMKNGRMIWLSTVIWRYINTICVGIIDVSIKSRVIDGPLRPFCIHINIYPVCN